MNARVPDMGTGGATHPPWNLLTEFGRQQLAAAAQGASALYRAREVVGAVQQRAMGEASVRHAKAARRLRMPCAPADFLALQSELARENILGAGCYWQQLLDMSLQTQLEMMASMSRLFDGEAGVAVKSALRTLHTVTPPPMNSIFSINRDSASGPR